MTFDAVQEVLRDGVRFTSSGYAEVMGQVMGHTILEMDEPEHHSYRSLIQQAFTRKAMEEWETELVVPIVDELIDDFADDRRAELVRALFFPFPVNVIAGLLGLPRADLPLFHRLTIEIISVSIDMEKGLRASHGLAEYLTPFIHERRETPGHDMISVLAHADHEGHTLDDDEILAFCRLLLPAGAETTYRSSSNLFCGLLTHPDQLDAVRADRTLLTRAIEEGLRWEPPLLMIMRTAARDTEVCGEPVPAGAVLAINLGSANHDDTRWRARGAVRHPARAARAHGVRVGAAHVPRHAPGAHGDARRDRAPARSPARRARRPRRPAPVHHRHDLPSPAAPRRHLGLTHQSRTRDGSYADVQRIRREFACGQTPRAVAMAARWVAASPKRMSSAFARRTNRCWSCSHV